MPTLAQIYEQVSVPAALQPPAPQHLPSRRVPQQQPPAAPNRHKRSVSIDIALLMATRDGTGPSKDYPAPAAPSPPSISHPPLPSPSQQQRPLHRPVDRVPSLTRDGSSFGHLTAPVALETLRQAHPGVTLAQAVSWWSGGMWAVSRHTHGWALLVRWRVGYGVYVPYLRG